MAACGGNSSDTEDCSLADQSIVVQLNSEDTIEGTVYSKSWVFALLVRLVDYVRTDDEISVDRSKTDSDPSKDRKGDRYVIHEDQFVNTGDHSAAEDGSKQREENNGGSLRATDLEIDEGLENELCKLWDASTNAVRI